MTLKFKFGKYKDKTDLGKFTQSFGLQSAELDDARFEKMTLAEFAEALKNQINLEVGEIELHSINFNYTKKVEE